MFAVADEFLSAQGVAERLGVSEKTVRRWINSRELQAEKRGRAYAIRLADALALRTTAIPVGSAQRLRQAEEAAVLREELAELRGRYSEARDRIAELEAQLREEMRRTAVLEARLDLSAA